MSKTFPILPTQEYRNEFGAKNRTIGDTVEAIRNLIHSADRVKMATGSDTHFRLVLADIQAVIEGRI
jgi:hypothetical protein